MKVVFESGPLITACKYFVEQRPVIDIILDSCEILIAPSVRKEVIDEGKTYPDGIIAGERLSQGKLIIKEVDSLQERILRTYKLGEGEIESILLFKSLNGEADFLTIDDNLAYIVSDRMGLKKVFLLDLVLKLTEIGNIRKETAKKIIEAVRPRYSEGFIEHSLEILGSL